MFFGFLVEEVLFAYFAVDLLEAAVVLVGNDFGLIELVSAPLAGHDLVVALLHLGDRGMWRGYMLIDFHFDIGAVAVPARDLGIAALGQMLGEVFSLEHLLALLVDAFDSGELAEVVFVLVPLVVVYHIAAPLALL